MTSKELLKYPFQEQIVNSFKLFLYDVHSGSVWTGSVLVDIDCVQLNS